MVERAFHFIDQVSSGWEVSLLLYHPKLGYHGCVTPHLAVVIKRLAAGSLAVPGMTGNCLQSIRLV